MKRRRIARALACAAAILLLFFCFYIALEAGHDCHGGGCPVCAQVRLCAGVLQSLLIVAATGVWAAAVSLSPARAWEKSERAAAAAHTLVSLKVRLDS